MPQSSFYAASTSLPVPAADIGNQFMKYHGVAGRTASGMVSPGLQTGVGGGGLEEAHYGHGIRRPSHRQVRRDRSIVSMCSFGFSIHNRNVNSANVDGMRTSRIHIKAVSPLGRSKNPFPFWSPTSLLAKCPSAIV